MFWRNSDIGKQFFDFDDGDFAFAISDNMAMGYDGNMMMRLGDNLTMDMDSGNLHLISSWDSDQDDSNDFSGRNQHFGDDEEDR